MPLPLLAIIAAASAVSGAAKASAGRKEKLAGEADAAALLKKRKGYQTPAELYKILNATEQNAQSGFDPATLGYLTSQTDRAFDSSLDTSKYLGGDPNDFSSLFDQKMNAIMKIGAENHQQNLANFNAYLGALGTIASSKDAEFVSGQNLIKDQQQNAQARVLAGTEEQANGRNTTLSAITGYVTGALNKDPNEDTVQKTLFNDAYGSKNGKGAYDYAKKNNLSFDAYKESFEKAKSLPNINF